ncbi:O-methyltransferase [Morchella snyderi]|nr:O-methyltransferase [Morchella snyderi]
MYTATELYPNVEVGNAVHEYCINHSTAVPKHIDEHRKDTIQWAIKTNNDADMMINTLQAQFLIFFARAQGIKRVLEIGMFTGYSALAWVEALKDEPNAEVVCLDIPGQSTDFARETFVKTKVDSIIKIIEGNAETSIDSLAGQKFDLVFIDANKDGYLTYFEKVLNLSLLSPKGIIIADNALKRGLVADNSERNPASKEEGQMGNYLHIDRFNKFVKDDPRVESMLLPAFDGLNMIRLK